MRLLSRLVKFLLPPGGIHLHVQELCIVQSVQIQRGQNCWFVVLGRPQCPIESIGPQRKLWPTILQPVSSKSTSCVILQIQSIIWPAKSCHQNQQFVYFSNTNAKYYVACRQNESFVYFSGHKKSLENLWCNTGHSCLDQMNQSGFVH